MQTNRVMGSMPLRRSLWRRLAGAAGPQRPEAGAAASAAAAECCRRAARIAASHYRVPVNEVIGRHRGSREAIRARHVAMYLAHVVYRLSLAEVGTGFRRDRTTAAYACGKIEDARDDPAFDAALSGLEISAGVLLDAESVEKAA